MKILVIHQNLPGQFRQLIPYMIQLGHEVMGICSHDRPFPDGVSGWRYKAPPKPSFPLELGPHLWFEGLQRASSVAHICNILLERSWIPDCILAHSGWGETLGIKEVFPHVPQIIWPELWTRPIHGGYGVDPLLPSPGLPQRMEQVGRNAMTRVALDQADAWVMPTIHQANSLPHDYQNHKLHVIHEGIDCNLAHPDDSIAYVVRGITITKDVPTITFVNRNLERLRGFEHFMRSLPQLLKKWPDLRVIIVGDNEDGYGVKHSSGLPLRQVLLDELSPSLDLERIHFLGRIPHPQLIAIMQISWVHVYLSYPFVLGWSLLEAMACGCAIVGSEGMPVGEVIQHDVNGLLVPINDILSLESRISSLLGDESLRYRLGQSARQTALAYDSSRTLPKFASLIESFAS